MGNFRDLTIEQCKNKCKLTPGCTAINVNTRYCNLRGCSLPIPKPKSDSSCLSSSYSGYNGYSVQGNLGLQILLNARKIKNIVLKTYNITYSKCLLKVAKLHIIHCILLTYTFITRCIVVLCCNAGFSKGHVVDPGH